MSERVKLLRLKQLRYANRRALLLVRALTAFYLSLGPLAAASLTSLLGATFVITHLDVPRVGAMLVALGCGVLGVGGLVTGSALLVWETRLAFAILREETDSVVEGLHLGESNANGEQERAGLDGRSSQSVPAGLPGVDVATAITSCRAA